MAATAFLTDADFHALAETAPVIEPFDPAFVRPASVDLRLGSRKYHYKFAQYTVGQPITDGDFEHTDFDVLELAPGETAFVGLSEKIKIPNDCVGFVFPRSSFTRLGLIIYPVYMNPGYEGRLPITITNSGTFQVQLIPRMHVAQLICAKLSSSPSQTYNNTETAKYHEEEVSPSKLHTDDEIRKALEAVVNRTFPNILDN